MGNVIAGIIVWGFTVFVTVGLIVVFLAAGHERYHEINDAWKRRK